MRHLLLVSTSTVHGTGYLDHCADEMKALCGADTQRVLFVPYALFDRDGYAAKARERFGAMGLGLDSLHEAPDPVAAVRAAQALFVGGGNTFRLVRDLHAHGLVEPIRERVAAGMPYMGTSAGSNVACPTLKTTNDMPIVEPPSFETLNLVPFQINPHFLDADPSSTHMGETRETRLAEFHEENETVVIGLREGAMLRVDGDTMELRGLRGGRLFQRGSPAVDLAVGADLSALL